MTDIQYAFIEDLPEDWPRLRTPGLENLAEIWKEQSSTLQSRDALIEFNQRLRREWAIETGIIENLYSIDRGITQLLIEKGIEASLIPHGSTDKPAELIVPILKDQEEVLEGLFDFVANRRDLSAFYLREFHQALTRHQDTVQAVDALGNSVEVTLARGRWKQQPNNPTRPDGGVHQYCPPEHVNSEIERLLELHRNHMGGGIPPDVEAAWLHHRFTQVHPFQDGNGRVARTLASLVFLRAGWFPLVINRDTRDDYIDALEKADAGDLRPLVNLFARIEKKAFIKALSLSHSVLERTSPLDQVIEAAADRLRARRQSHVRAMQSRAFELSERLESRAEREVVSVAKRLNDELKTIDQRYFADARCNDPDNDFWFKKQIIDVAKALDYYADTRTYRAWVRLRLKEERQTEIVVSFHALGVQFLGVMAVSAFLEYRDKSEDGEVSMDGPYALTDEVFQFSYREGEQEVEQRFDGWLRGVILEGLDRWRRQL